ncbi:MAG: hypothetical protein IT267_07770 [Saprospiraceae bacterium]|nr:hypothetical protein [Saprospiraceae bacterium]
MTNSSLLILVFLLSNFIYCQQATQVLSFYGSSSQPLQGLRLKYISDSVEFAETDAAGRCTVRLQANRKVDIIYSGYHKLQFSVDDTTGIRLIHFKLNPNSNTNKDNNLRVYSTNQSNSPMLIWERDPSQSSMTPCPSSSQPCNFVIRDPRINSEIINGNSANNTRSIFLYDTNDDLEVRVTLNDDSFKFTQPAKKSCWFCFWKKKKK